MSDLCDIAQQLEEQHLENALQVRKPILPNLGRCHNCFEPIGTGQHFCNDDCQQDYQARQRAKSMRKRFGC